jgi:glycosyltransferase involved in cell wall biosynthesis
MRVLIARTMPEFSMDVYADGLIAGLRAVRPDWDVVAIAPVPLSRSSQSWKVRFQKYYERFWKFPRMVQNYDADLVHVIDHSDGHIVYGLKGKPVVVTCHDLINYFYPQNVRGSVQIPGVSGGLWRRSIWGMKRADHVIAVSRQTANDVVKVLGIAPDRISVVPNATAGFKPLFPMERQVLRERHGLTEGTTCLLNVGSNHPRKNIETILRVVEALKAQGIPVQFWKVGADFTGEQKGWIAAHGLEEWVTYLGMPDQPTLMQFYNAADLLLAPSTHEGFGITLLEAMACGTPVITGNVSAMPEVVGDAGVLVDPLNVEAIAAAVLHLRRDEAYRELLRQKGLERVKRFTWEGVAEQVARIYEALVTVEAIESKVNREVSL